MQEDFYDVIKDPYARSILGDTPYFLAYHLAMIQCAWAMKQANINEGLAFVCDECEQYSSLAANAYLRLKDTNPKAAQYMASFSMDDEKRFDVLQAADAIVFEIRRLLNLTLGQWPGRVREQFRLLANAQCVHIIQHTNKNNLLKIVELHKPGEAFNLDEIMDTVFHEDIKITM